MSNTTRICLTLILFAIAGRASNLRGEESELPPNHSVEPELYATGFEFAEGPAFDRDGNLFVVNYRGNGNIGRITADGTASVWCVLDEIAPIEGKRSQANGLKVDSEGRLIVADAGGGRLLRVASDGKSRTGTGRPLERSSV